MVDTNIFGKIVNPSINNIFLNLFMRFFCFQFENKHGKGKVLRKTNKVDGCNQQSQLFSNRAESF